MKGTLVLGLVALSKAATIRRQVNKDSTDLKDKTIFPFPAPEHDQACLDEVKKQVDGDKLPLLCRTLLEGNGVETEWLKDYDSVKSKCPGSDDFEKSCRRWQWEAEGPTAECYPTMCTFFMENLDITPEQRFGFCKDYLVYGPDIEFSDKYIDIPTPFKAHGCRDNSDEIAAACRCVPPPPSSSPSASAPSSSSSSSPTSSSLATTAATETTSSSFIRQETSSSFIPEETSSSFIRQETTSSFIPEEITSSFIRQETTSSFIPEDTTSSFIPEETTSSFIPEETTSSFIPEETTAKEIEAPQETTSAVSSTADETPIPTEAIQTSSLSDETTRPADYEASEASAPAVTTNANQSTTEGAPETSATSQPASVLDIETPEETTTILSESTAPAETFSASTDEMSSYSQPKEDSPTAVPTSMLKKPTALYPNATTTPVQAATSVEALTSPLFAASAEDKTSSAPAEDKTSSPTAAASKRPLSSRPGPSVPGEETEQLLEALKECQVEVRFGFFVVVIESVPAKYRDLAASVSVRMVQDISASVEKPDVYFEPCAPEDQGRVVTRFEDQYFYGSSVDCSASSAVASSRGSSSVDASASSPAGASSSSPAVPDSGSDSDSAASSDVSAGASSGTKAVMCTSGSTNVLIVMENKAIVETKPAPEELVKEKGGVISRCAGVSQCQQAPCQGDECNCNLVIKTEAEADAKTEAGSEAGANAETGSNPVPNNGEAGSNAGSSAEAGSNPGPGPGSAPVAKTHPVFEPCSSPEECHTIRVCTESCTAREAVQGEAPAPIPVSKVQMTTMVTLTRVNKAPVSKTGGEGKKIKGKGRGRGKCVPKGGKASNKSQPGSEAGSSTTEAGSVPEAGSPVSQPGSSGSSPETTYSEASEPVSAGSAPEVGGSDAEYGSSEAGSSEPAPTSGSEPEYDSAESAPVSAPSSGSGPEYDTTRSESTPENGSSESAPSSDSGPGYDTTSSESTPEYGSPESVPSSDSGPGYDTTSSESTPEYGSPESAPSSDSQSTPEYGSPETAPSSDSQSTPEYGSPESPPSPDSQSTPEYGSPESVPTSDTQSTPEYGSPESAPSSDSQSTPEYGSPESVPTSDTQSTPEYGSPESDPSSGSSPECDTTSSDSTPDNITLKKTASRPEAVSAASGPVTVASGILVGVVGLALLL
ncbi:hypothetical protein GQ602_006597 [Ophiocordyceps camponoti-floridani]|uniref:Uncharacterized protein n=1 Tax=Ophiocordyceps camponoti-floridani TaxID=2030778 RepID=A0A8H4Q1J9_9HYPO|nr:hypothetical protein GQ602_006597 [Ophiocordyceps camponoti-floridani]